MDNIVFTTDAAQDLFGSSVSPHRRRCIDGSVTGCGKCVGYCKFEEHKGYLTKELRKEHNCLEKGCWYYQPKQKTQKQQLSSPFAVLAVLL